uniref:Isoform 2 of Uncharacterized protein LINC03042 n=1 Tax=Homo sapiens TaxID=9606 RepID=Q6ZUL3-2|eukprot:NP_001290460.1 uncharacterized protein C8orf86 isoform 2 [Homo sapiens]
MRPLGKGLLPAEELIRSNLGVGRSLRDCLSQSGKLAEELGSKRLKPAKFGTEGKERVEQRTERQRTGSSKEPRMQIICRRRWREPPPRLLWGCLMPRAQPLLHVTPPQSSLLELWLLQRKHQNLRGTDWKCTFSSPAQNS